MQTTSQPSIRTDRSPIMTITSSSIKRVRTAVSVALCAGLLAACSTGSTDLTGVRSSAQAVHPADTVKRAPSRTAYRGNRLSVAQATKLSNTLFDRYCLNKSSARASETALRRSGKFKTPRTITPGNARYVIYPLADGTRGGVTVTYNSVGGLRCSVGIQNIGPNLYENGRITRP